MPLPTREELAKGIERSTNRSLVLGLLLLVAFPSDGKPRGLGEVAGEIGISPSTAHRYLKTLTWMGLLERMPGGRRGYRRVLAFTGG